MPPESTRSLPIHKASDTRLPVLYLCSQELQHPDEPFTFTDAEVTCIYCKAKLTLLAAEARRVEAAALAAEVPPPPRLSSIHFDPKGDANALCGLRGLDRDAPPGQHLFTNRVSDVTCVACVTLSRRGAVGNRSFKAERMRDLYSARPESAPRDAGDSDTRAEPSPSSVHTAWEPYRVAHDVGGSFKVVHTRGTIARCLVRWQADAFAFALNALEDPCGWSLEARHVNPTNAYDRLIRIYEGRRPE